MPDITIAIPVHDRAQIVGRTLDSVHAQTYRPLSVVLIDNNSTDGSYDVLCQWRDRVQAADFQVTVLREATPGGAAARNAALAVADTPWLMFFDSDDTMDPDHVARAMATAHAHPEATIVGWPIHLVMLDGTSAVKPFAPRRIIYHGVMQGTMATQRYMAHTRLFRRAGGWNPSVMKWNDIELGTRLALLPDALAILAPSSPHPSIPSSEHSAPSSPDHSASPSPQLSASVSSSLSHCARRVSAEGSAASTLPLVHVYQTAESITGLTYHAKAAATEHALDVMYANLANRPDQCIIPLKMSVLAALYHREGYPADARRLHRRALALAPSAYRRLLQRFAYVYTRLGLPGLATLLSPLYP